MSFKINAADVANLNDTQLHEHIMKALADAGEIVNPPRSTDKKPDPVGSRDVNAEAQAELQSARTQAAAPTTPAPPKSFTRTTDRSAANAIRLTLGSNPLSTRTHFGENGFIPDFSVLFEILYFMDRKMIATDKFTRTAEFWTPLVTRIYIAVILHIQILKALQSAGRINDETERFLHWFDLTFPGATLPIPGPLTNILQCLANAHVAATNYKSHCPILPPLPPTTLDNWYLICNNLAPRLPNPLMLAHQYYHHLLFATTGNPTGRDVGRWARFGRTIYSTNTMADPAGPSTREPLTSTQASILWLLASPGFRQPYLVNQTIGNNLLDYASEMLFLLPPEISTVTAPTDTTAPSWREYLGFGSKHAWFTEFSRIMTDYCKHWKESQPYADISPIGHSGALICATLPTPADRPTTRFPTFASSYDVKSYILPIPESDELDGCVALVNTTNSATNTGLPYPGFLNNVLQFGPYYNLSLAKSGRDVDPLDGAGQVLSDHYHVQNPKS
jgi:hypothetical protein